MSGYVRVRAEDTGHEYSIPEGAPLDGVKVIDKPAVGPSGEVLPPKHRVLRAASKAVPADNQKPAGEGTNQAAQADKKE